MNLPGATIRRVIRVQVRHLSTRKPAAVDSIDLPGHFAQGRVSQSTANGPGVATTPARAIATTTSEDRNAARKPTQKSVRANICKTRTNCARKRERVRRNHQLTPSAITLASIHRSLPVAASCVPSRSADYGNIRFPLENNPRPENKKTVQLP